VGEESIRRTKESNMSEEQNKRIFRRVIEEAYGEGDLEVPGEVFAADFVEHQAGVVPPTVDGVKGTISFLRAAFPDLRLTIEEIIASGDKTWARLTARGTHRGQFMGLLPTGKPFAITVIDECRFENGKIVEHWGVADQLALMMQIGALPRSPQGKP
jgi:predicted ester cyclase